MAYCRHIISGILVTIGSGTGLFPEAPNRYPNQWWLIISEVWGPHLLGPNELKRITDYRRGGHILTWSLVIMISRAMTMI